MSDTGEGSNEGGLVAQLANDREAAFIEAVSSGADILEASKAAAYPHQTGGDYASGREPVQRAIKANVVRKIKTEGLGLAYRELKGLLKNGTTPAVKLGAIKLMFALNGLGDGDPDEKDKPLHEMTENELHRFMAKAQRVIERGGQPPILNVTPG